MCHLTAEPCSSIKPFLKLNLARPGGLEQESIQGPSNACPSRKIVVSASRKLLSVPGVLIEANRFLKKGGRYAQASEFCVSPGAVLVKTNPPKTWGERDLLPCLQGENEHSVRVRHSG